MSALRLDQLVEEIIKSSPTSEPVRNEVLDNDEKSSESKEGRAAKSAEDLQRIHSVYEKYFVSFMRVRYAWSIFALLVCWLVVDIGAVFAHATRSLDLYVVYSFVGMVVGFCLGGMAAYSYWACKNKEDVEATFKLSRGSDERLDLREKNIQLRLWRIISSAWVSIVGTITGAIVFRLYAWWQYGDQHVTKFHLSDDVLITLIGTTTASVIGIFLIVLHWLFPQSKKTKADGSE